MRRQARPAITAAIILAVIALIFLVSSYTSALGGCESCHAQVSTVSAKGTHAAVACVRCHVPSSPVQKFAFGVHVVTAMRLKVTDAGGGVMSIPSNRCESCHAVMGNKAAVVGQAVRINHQACVPKVRCTKCHTAAVHGADQRIVSGTDMFECLVCHIRVGQTVECDVCHRGRLARDRIRTGTFRVTHGTNWKANHGLGSVVACAACHESSKCLKCHGSGVPHDATFKRNHGTFAQTKDQNCTSCHRRSFCDSCHGIDMPHAKDFLRQHSVIAKRNGDTACKKCHQESDCLTCHTMHVHPGGAIGGVPK